MIIIICLIIFIIIGLFLIITYNPRSMIEGYDARYPNTGFTDCAEFCKTTAGCAGFGYNKYTNTCYPSQTTINGLPTDSIFKDQFTYSNAVCNKVKPIMVANLDPSFVDRRSNSVFVCSENADIQPSYYFHNNDMFENIGEGRNIDDIFDVDMYQVKPYDWPKNKYDYNNTDLLNKERESQTYVQSTVTDVSRIIDYNPTSTTTEVIVPPKIVMKPVFDFGLNNVNLNFKSVINNVFGFLY